MLNHRRSVRRGDPEFLDALCLLYWRMMHILIAADPVNLFVCLFRGVRIARQIRTANAAVIMGLDRQTVRSMHHKALTKLRAHFSEETEG